MTRAERYALTVLIAVSFGVGLTVANTGDFNIFYNAGRAVLRGVSPYSSAISYGFFNPLYVAIAFAPLALFPVEVADKIFAGVTFFVCGIAFHLATRRDWRLTLLLMLTPFPLMLAYLANLDELLILGAFISPLIGIWLVLIKPQLGIVVALLLLLQCYDKRSLNAMAWLMIPVTIAYIDSLSVGLWRVTPLQARWNVSLFPAGLIVGLPVAFYALKKRSRDAALFAGPFLTPYLGGPAGWILALPLLSRRWYLAVGAVVASWLVITQWRIGI